MTTKDLFNQRRAQLFADRRTEQQLFENLLADEECGTRLVHVQGIRGIGKTSLLEQFERLCCAKNIPVVLIAESHRLMPVSLMQQVRRGLVPYAPTDVAFRAFDGLLDRYAELKNRLVAVEAASGTSLDELAPAGLDPLLKEGGKQAGAVVGGLIGSAYTPVGTVAGAVLGGVAAELGTQAVEKLSRGRLKHLGASHQDIQFYLEAIPILTEAFLQAMEVMVSQAGRLTLMLDDWDTASLGLESWIQELISSDVLQGVVLVLAGQQELSLGWEPWLPMSCQIKLDPFDRQNARLLLQKWGLRDDEVMDAIADATAGLPLGLAMAADQQIRRPVAAEEAVAFFGQTVGSRIVSLLLDEMRVEYPQDLLNACAILRWYDTDVLANVIQDDEVQVATNLESLWLSPIATVVQGGKWALHEVVRTLLEKNLKQRSRSQWRALHARAADYHSALRRSSFPSEETWEMHLVEEVYHRVSAEEGSVQTFAWLFAGTLMHWIVGPSEEVLKLMCQLPIRRAENRAWLSYFSAQLQFFHGMWGAAEPSLLRLTKAGPLPLRARAATTLGAIYQFSGRVSEALEMQKLAISIDSEADPDTRAHALLHLARAYYTTTPSMAVEAANEIERLLEGDTSKPQLGRAFVIESVALVRLGHWDQAYRLGQTIQEIGERNEDRYLVAMGHYVIAEGLLHFGRWREAIEDYQAALSILEPLADAYHIGGVMQHLMEPLVLLRRFEEAKELYSRAAPILTRCGATHQASRLSSQLARIRWCVGDKSGAMDLLQQTRASIQNTAERPLLDADMVCILGQWLLDELLVDQAAERFQEALQVLGDGEEPRVRAQSLVGLLQSLAELGVRDSASLYAKQATETLEEYPDRALRARLALSHGRMVLAADRATAVQHYWDGILEACQYNCFALDATVNAIISQLRKVVPDMEQQRAILDDLADRWTSTALGDRPLASVEASLRARENCPATPAVLDRLCAQGER